MKNKTVNGIMFTAILYLLLFKYRIKASCVCVEEVPKEQPSIPEPVKPVPVVDPVLETAPIAEPPKQEFLCRENKFIRVIDDNWNLISWFPTYIQMATYKLHKIKYIYPDGKVVYNWAKIGVVPTYKRPTAEEYEQYCQDYRAGKYTTPDLDKLPIAEGFKQSN
jgi:hypothetical protein